MNSRLSSLRPLYRSGSRLRQQSSLSDATENPPTLEYNSVSSRRSSRYSACLVVIGSAFASHVLEKPLALLRPRHVGQFKEYSGQ